MGTWILVIMLSSGTHGSVAVTTQEFYSKNSCMAAASFLQKKIPERPGYPVTSSFNCVEK